MRKFLIAIAVLLGLLVLAVAFYLFPRLQILNGHAAKTLCSCVFVGGIDEDVVKKEDIGFFPVALGTQKVDHDQKRVTANFFGFKPKTAIYREGLGCAIFNESSPSGSALDFQKINFDDSLARYFEVVAEKSSLTAEQYRKLQAAMDWAFEESDPGSPSKITRATLVLHEGKLVGEQYAKGFDKDSDFWVGV